MHNRELKYPKLPEPIKNNNSGPALEREYYVCSILFGLSVVTALALGVVMWGQA